MPRLDRAPTTPREASQREKKAAAAAAKAEQTAAAGKRQRTHPQAPQKNGRAEYRGATIRRVPLKGGKGGEEFVVHVPRAVAKGGKECDVHKKILGNLADAWAHVLEYVDRRV